MTKEAKKYFKEVVWIRRGLQRKAILKVMEKLLFPSEIQQEARKSNPKISLNNCSDALRSFVKAGLAFCLNPKEKVGRLYILTPKGKRVRKEIFP